MFSLLQDVHDAATQMKFEELDLGIEPVNGIVQPPVIPPENKPHRNTDALQYMLKYVLKAILKHKFAWPFMDPVNAEMLHAVVSFHSRIFHFVQSEAIYSVEYSLYTNF